MFASHLQAEQCTALSRPVLLLGMSLSGPYFEDTEMNWDRKAFEERLSALREFKCDERRIYVTPGENLFEALRNFSKEGCPWMEHKHLWADAICLIKRRR
jgi:hypothetical protein